MKFARRSSALVVAFVICTAAIQAQTSYTWNGSASSAWNDPSNWTPGSGFPLAADHVTIVAVGTAPVLDMARSVTNITVNGGTLNLNGFTLTSTGNGNLNGGSVNNGTFAPNTAGSMNFAGTTFGAAVTGSTGVLQFAGSTFNAPVNLTKTGGGYDYSSGNTTFNASATFSVTAGRLYLANTGATVFNGNVVVNSTGTSGGLWMGQTTGTLTLAPGRTFSAGTYTSGSLLIRNFNQLGTSAQTILIGPACTLYFQAGSTFNGDVSTVSGGLYLNGATFNGAARYVKTGAGNEYSGGGNVWQGTCEFTSGGPGILYLANTGSDLYNGDLRVNSTSTGGLIYGNSGGTSTLAPGRTISVGSSGYPSGYLHLRGFVMPGTTAQSLLLGVGANYAQFPGFLAGGDFAVTAGSVLLNGGTVNGTATYVKNGGANDWGTGGCTFNGDLDLRNNSTGILGTCNTGIDAYNGDIRVSNTSTASIRMGNGSGSGILASGKTISVGPGGYASGLFLLERFTQVGTTPQSLTFGSAVDVYIRQSCSFGAQLMVTAGGFYIEGSVFAGDCRFTKLGSGGESSNGGNTFQGDLELVNMGTGQLYFANTVPDSYAGNVIVNNATSGQIRFGNGGTGGGTITMGHTLSVGSIGYANGLLMLRNITQTGSTPQTLMLGTNASLYVYPGCSWDGDFTVSAGSIYLAQSTYNGRATFIKTGTGTDGSVGGNVFGRELELTNTSTGGIYMAQTIGDTFSGDVLVNNLTNGQIRFGSAGGTTSTLASGHTISVGSGGFAGGLLLLRGFVQQGPTPQSITTGPMASIYFYPGTIFDGDITTNSGSLYFYSTTFNGTGHFIKNDATADVSQGGCTFNGDIEFENLGSGSIYLAESFGDAYNGNVLVSNMLNGQFRIGSGGVSTSILASGRTLGVGAGGFNAGIMVLRGLVQVGPTPQNLQLGPLAILHFYPGSVFDGDMVARAGGFYFYGTTFNASGIYTKTGTGGEGSQGGCIFNGDVEFLNTNTGNLSLDFTGNDLFNGNIRVSSTSSGQINFGQNGGSATLAAGRTITVGSSGFGTGSLFLRNFVQLGATAQNLPLGASAGLYYYPGTVFNGNVVSTSGTLYLSGTTFNGTGKFTKTGPSGDGSQGNCVFNGYTEFINTGTGNLSLDFTGLDMFNADVRLNNTGSGEIQFGQNGGAATLAAGRTIAVGSSGFTNGRLFLRNFTQLGSTPQTLLLATAASLYFQSGNVFNGNVTSTSGTLYLNGTTFNGTGTFTKTGPSGDGSQGGNSFNGNVVLTNTSTGNLSLDYTGVDVFNADVRLNNNSTGQIQFGQNGGSATLAAGYTIAAGSSGFSSGQLLFRNFTQSGATPQHLVLGSAASLTFGTGNTFNGDLVTTSGTLFLNGTVFNGTSKFTKTGTSGDGCLGGNIFNQNAEFIVSGTGHLSLDQTGPDMFMGDILLNSTSTGQISFGQVSGTATLAPGRTVSVGALGFNTGTLNIRQFAQLGTTPQSIMLGTNASCNYQTGTVFNANLTTSAGNMSFTGTTFNGSAWIRKTGASGNGCAGNNLFNGNVELVNTGAGSWTVANVGADVYQGDLLLNSTAAGGITFGNSTGTSVLNTGVLGIGATGFTAGTITFRNFTKASSSASVLSGAVNTGVTFATGNTFNGGVSVTTGNLLFNGTVFNGNGVFNKTGTANNASNGGNVFNGDLEINTAGQMSLSVNAADDYNGNAIFRRLAAGTFTVGYNFNATFSKNVSTVGSTGGSVSFGNGSGRTIFDGTTVQSFSADAAFPPVVRNMTLAMAGAGELQLLGSVIVTQDVAFTTGVVKPMAATSTSNGLLILNAGTTLSDPADSGSYVDGFVRKIGNTAFSFPVGNAGVLAPVSITAPGAATHHFTAKYVHEDSHPTYTHTMHDITLDHLSRCEYWILDRTNSTTNVTVSLAFDSIHSCGVTNLADLVVARWNGSMWKDHGNGGTTGTTASGTIKTLGPVTAFSPFTLASRTIMNPLPVELVDFSVADGGVVVNTSWTTATEIDNDLFEVERSTDGVTFERIGSVDGAGYSQTMLHYAYSDVTPLPGTSYYRLKQIDFDGSWTHSDIVAVVRGGGDEPLRIWPNPAVDGLNVACIGGQRITAIQVHDASGRLLLDRSSGAAAGMTHLDLTDAPSGMLFVSVHLDDGAMHQQRILKE